MKVYTAGPITGLSFKGCTEWREAFAEEFSERPDIKVVSPMRLKDHLAGKRKIKATGYDDEEIFDSRAVVGRDSWDVRTADVILLNLAGAEIVSIGTMCELGFAAALNKMIITVMPPEERTERVAGQARTKSKNPHDHLFVYELSSIIVADLETAAELIHAL